MSLKTKILLLSMLSLLPAVILITAINVYQADMLSREEIHTFEENLLSSKRNELKNYISLALTSIEHITQDKNLDEMAAREGVKQILNGLTYGEDGYFFVYDRHGINLVHPILDELVGHNLYDLQDANGGYIIRDLLRIAEEGGGFHRYHWNKPSSDRDEEKLSYVVQVSVWGWMIGTGLYIDDITDEMAIIRKQVNINVRNSFLSMLLVIVGAVLLIALVGFAINLHESKLANIQQRKLAHKFVRLQVSERRRFARELHDGINQLMVSVRFRIESAINKLQKGQVNAVKDMECGRGILNDAIQEVRQITHGLRPSLLDDMGLDVALENLADQFSERTCINSVIFIGQADERLTEVNEITFYRVAQEALTNIERHAGKCNVQISLRQHGSTVTLDIKDDGHGFGPGHECNTEGIGLRNMQERVELLGGEFYIQSRVNEGTRLRATLPNEL
ncbi:MAG: cache domain-containing protein [Candidatus Sedimenticola sp. (ex Thyasira tokunagai)]